MNKTNDNNHITVNITDEFMKNTEDRFVKVSLLLDYYESVLSKKQFDTLDMYYNKDMSLSEIGESLGITRQGVYEILKRGEEKLFDLEEKLHCHELTVACDGLRKALLKVTSFEKSGKNEAAIETAAFALEKYSANLKTTDEDA